MRYLVIIFATLLGAWACSDQEAPTNMPLPSDNTVVKEDMEEGSKRAAREEWIELLHQSDTNTYWRNIEAERAWQNHTSTKITSTLRTNETGYLQISGDTLYGRWIEKGSKNQAGSVIATTYDKINDEIYLISAGGSLFKGPRTGDQWEVVNESLRFSGRLLDFMDLNGTQRLIAVANGIPAYSDDKGKSWHQTEDWMDYSDGWGGIYHPAISTDSQTIVLMAKPSYWSKLQLFYSSDKGESYHFIREMGSHDPNKYDLVDVHNSNDLLLVDKVNEATIDIYQFREDSLKFELIQYVDETGFGDKGRANLSCIQLQDTARWMYLYDTNNDVFFSSDSGKSWKYQSTLPASPWGVGLYALPSDPSFLLMGAVECFKSKDKGKSWEKQNGWGEYYSNVYSKLHADMMYFREFQIDKDTFIAISNHGGLSLSYDKCITTENIGMQHLNVSQYYSVATDPLDSRYIYAGSQDQGFQRAINQHEGSLDFQQTISGDYGHIVFSEQGQHLWSVYPGGWVIYYDQPKTGRYPSQSYDLQSKDETVWLPPLEPNRKPNTNGVFLAGGNIDGGEGSFLIQLDEKNGQIEASQFDFDVLAQSGGKISAIHHAVADHERLYIATTNGKFYRSDNFGSTWEAAALKVPGSHYLYGASIISSKYNADLVFMGGSGYSSSPVVFSRNGGRSFLPFRRGLPSTTVFGLAMDTEERFLFAATEAGPYVCILDQGKWYPMGEGAVPNQTYWSVEYVETEDIVRFGTYGRGIWDFKIEQTTRTANASTSNDLVVYPNPFHDFVNIDMKGEQFHKIEIYNLEGKKVYDHTPNGRSHRLNLSDLTAGVYFMNITDNDKKVITRKVLKQ